MVVVRALSLPPIVGEDCCRIKADRQKENRIESLSVVLLMAQIHLLQLEQHKLHSSFI